MNPSRRIVFRADASSQLGLGHLMRCMALADYLKELKFDILFLTKKTDIDSQHLILTRGFKVEVLSSKITSWHSDLEASELSLKKYPQSELMVLDHYLLDAHWEQGVKKYAKKLLVLEPNFNSISHNNK